MSTTHFTLLAAALRSREVWDEFETSGEAALAPEDLEPIITAVRAYYANDPGVKAADPVLVGTLAYGTIRDPKRREEIRTGLAALVAADASVPNAREAIRALRTRRVCESLATKLLIPSKDGQAEIAKLIDEYLDLGSAGIREDSPPWSAEALGPALGEPRIPIYPRSLGDKLRGGLWPGHHMTVFARPEIGKSAFCLTVAVMAANRSKAKILYCTNEDPVRDLMVRALCQFTGTDPEHVLKDLTGALVKARALGAERIRFHDMAPGSPLEIDRLVRKHKPDLVIVDQLRNMLGQKTENMTQKLDSLAQGVRNIAKRNNVSVLSVTQAGDSARDKAILDDGDVDNSNTGISAGCDVLVGIGATQVMREAGERRLSIIKNKLGGRHGYVDVRLDPITLAFREKT